MKLSHLKSLCGIARWPQPSFLILFAAAVLLFGGAPARAAIELRTIATGLTSPLYVTSAGDGSGRLFIVEQAGRIRILSSGAILPTPFLDIRDRVRSGGELGLLGLAFHPRYPTNGRFFVNYTRNGPDGLETVIAEYAVSPTNANLALRDPERILLRFAQPFENHNGGMLAFGPDGYLYIGTGDGGSGGDPMRNGQSVETLLGKILRIDVDSGDPYASPPDNPFVGRPGRDEIWAYGLRNPWRFSFDRLTARLIAGDVGQNTREEIDIIVKGGNYGWNIMEGTLCFSPSTNCNRTGLILPIHDYGRDLGISVTGGYVYRGRSAPSLTGKYLFGDYGSGRLWGLTELSSGQWEVEQLLAPGFNISSFGEDESGEVYVVDYGGSVRQIIESGTPVAGIRSVVNSASFLPGPIAPGEIITLFGTEIGPAQPSGAQLDSSGRVSTLNAGTRVFFNGVPAPLFYVSATQLNVQVPFAMATAERGIASVDVMVQDTLILPFMLSVTASAPGIFTRSGGSGQGAILNQDTTPNSSANPAPRGSIVVIYATGEGQTTPAGADGRLAVAPYPRPLLPVSLTIGGLPAEVLFAGSAPGFAGLLQVNARVPSGVAPGPAVPVVLTIGGASSQQGVTIAVN